MDRKRLKIAIVDDSKTSISYIKLLLKKLDLDNIIVFQSPTEFLEHLEDNTIDIAFIDYIMPELTGVELLQKIKKTNKNILTVMMTNSSDIDVKVKAIKHGVSDFMLKNVDLPEFTARVNILINLRLSYYQLKNHQDSLEETLKYKDKQEEMTLRKQYKIIEDYVSNHFYGNWVADSYFKPFDIVSGDSYLTLRISDTKFFVAVVDGMGKGVSASISSVLTIAFMNHSLSKSISFNDYNFDRAVKDTFHYVKSILLEDEALSFAMAHIDIEKENIKYANFGLPPFYLKRNDETVKIKSNNSALLLNKEDFVINEVNGFDAVLIASDGLTESVMNNAYPYLIRFKEIFKNSFILSEIIKDFNEKVEEADDDMTIFYLTKDKFEYETIYDKKILINRENIENLVNNIEFELPQNKLPLKITQKIVFSLNELLLNSLEHSVLKLGANKHQIVKNDIKIEYNDKDKYVHIKILVSDRFVILFLEDEGEGFEINDIFKKEWFNRYHGRGLKMLKSLSDGIYYDVKGNKTKLYFKKENK
jgi:FixJ family two-component response regulator/anti-sigma regulatory factor (Ser/Thr protein kinase)/serine/threonine protein phosphatase PrpC